MTTWTRIERLAVSAGQAEVWLVKDRDTGDTAIMKRLFKTPAHSDGDRELRRFKREVRSQLALDHPGIMPILGFNFSSDPPWYIMPRAEKTLEELIEEHPSGIDAAQAADIILAVADAVEYAHQQGIHHRDIKPGNILLLDGDWVVGDFGMCRDLSSDSTTITQPNSIVGTVAYMAPEQFDDGHDVRATADVFALSRVFLHMLTGRRPFPVSHLDKCPAEYLYLITKGLADNPEERHASVAEFARQIELIANPGDSWVSVEDRGKVLLAKGLKGDAKATAALLDLLVSAADDEVLYTSFVAKLPEPMLAAMQASNRAAFEQLVRTFDDYSEGGHPFNYVDVIADFFAMVFRVADSSMIRRMALHRVMVVGAAHNRFYVGNVFARLVASLKDPNEILMAADVMRSDRSSAHWYRDYFESKSALAPPIRDILDEAS